MGLEWRSLFPPAAATPTLHERGLSFSGAADGVAFI